MPIARFQMPDGQIGRFEVPEGTSPEDAQTLIQQHLSGGTQAKTNPFMDLLKEQAGQVKELFPQNAEEKAKLQAKLGNINPQDYYNIAQGFMPATGVGKVVNQLFPNIAEQATKSVSRTLPQWLMQSALKPSVKDLETGKAQQAINTLLEENVNPTQGSTIFGKGLDTLQGKVNVLNDQIKNMLSTSTATVSKSDVAQYLNGLKEKAMTQVNPESDLAAIDKVQQEFAKYNKAAIETPTMQIPIQLAQKLKQGTYKSLGGKVYGELKASDIEAQKVLAKGLKEKIAQAEPAIAGLNAEESRLLNALNVSERRALIEANKDMLGLSNMTRDAKTQLLAMADRSAPVKALLARMVYNTQKIPAKLGGLLENKVPNVMTPDNPEVIIPNILKGMGLLSSQDNQ